MLSNPNCLIYCYLSPHYEVLTHNTGSSLATCKGCTVRTIMNHKDRLKQAGFIIKEEHRGAQGIELWINPLVLETNTSANPLFLEEEKNFHPLVHEPYEQRNNNSRVDKSEGVRSEADGGGFKTTRTKQEPDMNTGKNAKSAMEESSAQGEADRISLLSLVMNFWEFARKILYPDIILSEPETKDIMNMIWRTVYGGFKQSWNLKEWTNYHEKALERIVMVRKWLDRSPEHWIPPPHIYFHPNNDKNGFQKTLQWLLKREILKVEVRGQIQLQRIKKEQELHQYGKGRYQHLNRLQLFRLHEQRLRRYKDPQLLNAYYHSLTKQQTYDATKGH